MTDTETKTEWRSRVEHAFTASGLDCIVVAANMGHRCGYVRVPEGHPWHGVAYNEATDVQLVGNDDFTIDDVGTISAFCYGLADDDKRDEYNRTPSFQVRVHGGLTYSGDQPTDVEKGWWFGFDCAHSGDAKDPDLMAEEYRAMEARWPDWDVGAVVRTMDYVAVECAALAAQLAAVAVAKTREQGRDGTYRTEST